MTVNNSTMRGIPSVDRILTAAGADPELAAIRHETLVHHVRQVVEAVRQRIKDGTGTAVTVPGLIEEIRQLIKKNMQPNLKRAVNAAGVIIHTNLGRAPLSDRAKAAVQEVMHGYSTLEYDVESGSRGLRYDHVADKICRLTGAEDAIVVNNNAAAVLLTLSALTHGKEVIVSRGQLVEIGGSFRVPDVLRQSGATLVEVGTTNKTHLHDYKNAIGPNTGAILKVHTSNYRIIGFTSQPGDADLIKLAHDAGLPVIEDLGSGTMLPVETPDWREPPVSERIALGYDVVTFSGDKLLGAGQAGIIAGRKKYIDMMKRHPLLRAVRIDKLSLAALEGTLLDYLAGNPNEEVPVQRMLARSPAQLEEAAAKLAEELAFLKGMAWSVEVAPVESRAGGGALPGIGLTSSAVAIKAPHLSAEKLEAKLRKREIPIIARIKDETVLIDVRCLLPDDAGLIRAALLEIAKGEYR